jgi:hypothetical protein
VLFHDGLDRIALPGEPFSEQRLRPEDGRLAGDLRFG